MRFRLPSMSTWKCSFFSRALPYFRSQFLICYLTSRYDIQKKFGSLKKLGYRCKHSNQLSSQSSSLATSLAGSEQSQDVLSAPHSLDRKYLRFLSTSKSQNVPVPTAQFRSYRRVVATDHCPPFPGNPKPIDGSLSTSVKVDGSLVDTTSSSIERFLQSSARNINSSYGDTDVR